MTAFATAPVGDTAGIRPGCGCCGPPGWGAEWELGTAAFWVGQARAGGSADPGRHRLGASLGEELVACMLGGFGVPGPVGNAAFEAVRAAGLLDGRGVPTVDELAAVLARPLDVPGRARPVRYRFHQQRPARIAAALSALQGWAAEADSFSDVDLRARLMELPGVGPKTASWVVRNLRGSDEVAIIDIHVRRAGTWAGVFCPHWDLPRDYVLFEGAFLRWAGAGLVSAADLDAQVWQLMAAVGRRGPALFAPATGRARLQVVPD